MKKILPVLLLLFISKLASSQIIIQHIYAQVIYLDDYTNYLDSALVLGDTLTGTFTFSANATDNNTDPTVGDYWFSEQPFGVILNGPNGLVWKTDSSNVSFLVEAVNRPEVAGGDAIVYQSYNNIYSSGDEATDKHIAWQLDNPDGTILSNTDLPLSVNLNAWTQVFALTIEANDFPNGEDTYFIRANVYKISNEIGTGIQPPLNESDRDFFPNPATSVIRFSNAPQLNEVDIYDVSGKLMSRILHPPSQTDISYLPAGIYSVKLITHDSASTNKLVKQ